MTIALVRITPNPDFIDSYLELLTEVKEAVKYDCFGEDIVFDGCVNYDREPEMTEEVIELRLDFEDMPYSQLIDIATEHNCNMRFILVDDESYNPDYNFDNLDYELEEFDDGIWLCDTQWGMNVVCDFTAKTILDEDNNKWCETHTNTLVPYDKNEYYLMYMAGGDFSFSSDMVTNGGFYKDFAEYIKKLAQEQTFLSFDEFGEGDWTIYVVDINKFIDWLKTR